MRAFVNTSYLVLLSLVLLTACTKKQAVVSRPAFCADSAYAYIEKQMSYGPRVPNSKAHNDCAVWFIQTLRAQGATVELQRGQMPDYRGNMQQIYNIIAHFSTQETAARPRVLLGAHYDTRPWCDEEEDYNDRFYNVPGANDGASGVGVLLEVARQTGLRMADSALSTPVDIVFFDCEDMGTPHFYTGAEREDTWCLGSQLWATNYVQNNGAPYAYGIVLDMVGAPDASFPLEMYSSQYAGNYQQQIWRSAEQLGYGSMFTKQQSYPITDDHYYINYIAGIPCVDIIHYDIRNATGFPHWWHTRNDNLDNISKATLQAVGEVVMSQIK
ncbi:MAG: M28 family peptidase [Paludibacteraceae bacterium]|nr:M28 family peptidase [Paludibacteraceae bacterium]